MSTPYEIIYKKRNGDDLSVEEITSFVENAVSGEIPDYQVTAFLMAVFFRGMSSTETAAFTISMRDSGEVIDLSGIPGPKIDKHSTGGVGDKISIPLAPLVASCGVLVPMMSGRGLGHTGGTLDKLESIPGFTTSLSIERYKEVISEIGFSMIGQTKNIAPADKKFYALRDVTATVDSLPLIAASIMSKKLAAGPEGLVLDVKTGTGAFMQKYDDAKALAQTMVDIGKKAGKGMQALITDMNQPLGNMVGNALEIRESIDVLKGTGPDDVTRLVMELGSEMLLLAGMTSSPAEGKKTLEEKIKSGAGLEKFRQLIIAQDGNPEVIDNPDILPHSEKTLEVVSQRAGVIQQMSTTEIGMISLSLGAGREKVSDDIEPGAGIEVLKKIGDTCEKNEPICRFYYSGEKDVEHAKKRYSDAVTISDDPPENLPSLIYERLVP